MQTINEKIFWYFYNFAHQSTSIDSAIIFTAGTLGTLILIVLIIFLFSHEHIRARSFSSITGESVGRGFHNIIVILASATLAWGIARLIKMGFPADRPFIAIDGVIPLLQPSDSGSFPSGHATFFSGIGTALYFYHKKLGMIALLAALAIGIARIMAGVHWPMDIFAGILIGGLLGFLLPKAYYRVLKMLQ